MKELAIANLSPEQRAALKPVLDAQPNHQSPRDLLAAREFVKEWTLEELIPIVQNGLNKPHDLERGRKLYGAVACNACHRFGTEGGGVGPDLTAVAGRFGVPDLLQAIVEPSKVVSDQYAAVSIATTDGRIVTGRVGNLSGDNLHVIEDMFDPGHFTNVNRSHIEEMRLSDVSLMPSGLLNTLTADEIEDLIAFLLARKDTKVTAAKP
jgi:putative heme-binding domain-containing protein